MLPLKGSDQDNLSQPLTQLLTPRLRWGPCYPHQYLCHMVRLCHSQHPLTPVAAPPLPQLTGQILPQNG